MISHGLSAFRNRRVLLLQGPVGPFFSRLSQDLTRAGAEVFKVNFNGGDWAFYSHEAINFQGTLEEWPGFLNELITLQNINTLMLFGDCRIHHTLAHDIARKRGVEVGVFEEGYFRPNYVTLEQEGVNGYSPLPDKPIFYLNNVPTREVRTEHVGGTFWHAAGWAVLYYLAASLLRMWFPHYRHHRPLRVLEGLYWVRSLWRKTIYRVRERGIEEKLVGELSKQFFLVPLQVHNDAQIHVHSRFDSVEAFIRYAVASFAQNAPADTLMVVKHHPLDRGYTDYTNLIQQLGREFGLGKRLVYVHDLHLPSLLQHAQGVVVVNSTVGLSALHHKAALKVCGEAIYDIQGLTFQGELDAFWTEAPHVTVNAELYKRFRGYVIELTQLNGSFYKRMPIPGSHTGVRWEERWAVNPALAPAGQPATVGSVDGVLAADVLTAANEPEATPSAVHALRVESAQ